MPDESCTVLEVERSRWLVEQEAFGLLRKRARERNHLSLAAGKLCDGARFEVRGVEFGERSARRLNVARRLEAKARRVRTPAREHDFERGERKDGRDRLRHVCDATRTLTGLDARKRHAAEEDFAARGLQKSGEQSHER